MFSRTGSARFTLILIIIAALSVIVTLGIGRYPVPPLDVVRVLGARLIGQESPVAGRVESVILVVRLPRVIAGFIVGAGLAVSGAAFQAIFKNPLVSSQILGVASGAGFGAAIAILLAESLILIQVSSFVFGLLAVFLTYMLSRMRKRTSILMLVLSGIVISSLFSALTSMTKYVADPMNKMPAITFWLLGSLNHVSARQLYVLGPIMAASMGLIFVLRWRINVLTMGDEEARSMGIDTEKLKAVIIVCATLITAASVCICGIIGWIGLVIPHIGRLLVGPDNRRLIPAAILLGGAFLILVDATARSVSSSELPIGILTSVIGAPIFALLLRKSRRTE